MKSDPLFIAIDYNYNDLSITVKKENKKKKYKITNITSLSFFTKSMGYLVAMKVLQPLLMI